MAQESDQKRGGTTLLPPSGTLMPPSNGGSLLNMGTESGQELAAELGRAGAEAKELASRAGAEAKDLASKAAALAVEKAPEIKKKAQDFASRAAKEAEAASKILADAEKREAFLATHQQKIGIGLAAVLLLVGGGWMFAKHQATVVAKDRIDGFLIRNNLSSAVSYTDLSASPFGSVTLSGVSVRNTQNQQVVKAEALEVSDIDMNGTQLRGLKVAAKSVEVPLLTIARTERLNPEAYQLIGLGYTTLNGDISVGGRFDDQQQTLSFEAKGDMPDLGNWNGSIKIGGISPASIGALYNLSQAANQNNPMALLAGGIVGMQAMAQSTLVAANLTIDNSGYMKRQKEIPAADMPTEGAVQAAPANGAGDAELVRAGMSPSDARATREALQSWMANGGKLHIETNRSQPLPLFQSEGMFGAPVFAFSDLPTFIVATNAKVSN